MSDANDLVQIGISEKMHPHLVELKEQGYFAQMMEAYRFAIALALVTGEIPPEIQAKQTTFNATAIDPDGSIRTAIRALMPCDDVPPYRWAERLADAGMQILAEKMARGTLDISTILREAEQLS